MVKEAKEKHNITARAVKSPLEIGGIIKIHREKANLTQLELAELSGTGKTVVFDLEKGKPTVKLATLLKVFQALNISLLLDSPIMTAPDKSK